MNQTPRAVLAITAPWSARVYAVARETHGRVCPLVTCYLLPVPRLGFTGGRFMLRTRALLGKSWPPMRGHFAVAESGTWQFADAWITVNVTDPATAVAGLFNASGRIRIPPASIEKEFFGGFDPRGPDPFEYGSTELPPACLESDVASVPAIFVMTVRFSAFQMYDQLRHGIGTAELFRRTFPSAHRPGAAAVPILLLDTSYRAISTRRLHAVRPERTGNGLALPLLAMGFEREEAFHEQASSWWDRSSGHALPVPVPR